MNTTYINHWYLEIVEYLRMLVDSATNKDKLRVRFVKNLDGARNGQTVYSFKPSSPLCYIAFNFVQQILQTVVDSPDVSFQQVIVTEHLADNELTIVIDKEK